MVFNKLCPRNQRYLHPRGIPSGVFVFVVLAKCYKGGEFAIYLYLELTLLRHETDSLDQAADCFGGVGYRIWGV